jgi:hypothetical protein
MDSSGNIYALIFFTVVNLILPNVVILCTYFLVLYKVRKLKKNVHSRGKIEPPRITIQLMIYITMYELNCAANFIMFMQTVMMYKLVSSEALVLLRISRWFHHFSPLALLYLHPVLLAKYRNALKLKSSTSQ